MGVIGMLSVAMLVANGPWEMEQATKPGAWLPAKVPGTVLQTLIENKVVPEPYYGLNNKYELGLIPDLRDNRDFYTVTYRTKVTVPADWKGRKVFMRPEGIDYRGEIRLNGQIATVTAGMFQRTVVEVEGEGCVEAFTIPFDATGASRLRGLAKPHFVKLRLFESGREIASTFYWRSNSVYREERREEAIGPCAGGFEELVNLPRTTLKVERTAKGIRVTNTGDKLAFFVRVKAMKDGKLVVPVHYSDNYLNLLPDELSDVEVEDLPQNAEFNVSAWNADCVKGDRESAHELM